MLLPERLSTRHWEFLTTLGTVIRLFRCGCRVCALPLWKSERASVSDHARDARSAGDRSRCLEFSLPDGARYLSIRSKLTRRSVPAFL